MDEETRRAVFIAFGRLTRGKWPQSDPNGSTRAEEIAWRMFEAAAKVLEEEEKRRE